MTMDAYTVGSAWEDMTDALSLQDGQTYLMQASSPCLRIVRPDGAPPNAIAWGQVLDAGADGEREYTQERGQTLWMRALDGEATIVPERTGG